MNVAPKTGWINLTIACNMRCTGCYTVDAIAKSANEGTERSMPKEDVLKLMHQMKEMGCRKIILLGGEPTIHPNFIELYTYAREKLGFEVRFATNGRSFSSKKFCDSMKSAGLTTNGCTFSMHAPNNELSEKFAGTKDGFRQFDLGLKNLVSEGLHPNVNIVLTVGMLPYVKDMMLYLKDLGLRKVSFNLGSPAVEGDGVQGDHCIPPDELANHSYELFQFGKTIGLKASFLYLIPFCLLDYSKIKEMVEVGSISSGCQISSGSGVLFNKDGDLIPCNHMQDKVTLPKQEIQEIIETGRFPEFWNSDGMKQLRATTSVFRSDHCRTCSFYDMCGGGCALFWTHFDPKVYIQGVREKVIPIPKERKETLYPAIPNTNNKRKVSLLQAF